MKILIVDDSVSVRKALERLLLPRGLEVLATASAEEALRLLPNSDIRAVISDVVMPGMDGFALCRTLKEDAQLRDLPVILISGIVNDSVLSEAQSAGAAAVVKKPFMPEDLLPKLEHALARNDTPATLSQGNTETGDLASLLKMFLDKPGVDSVLLIDADGHPLTEAGRSVADPSLIGAYCRTLTSISGALGDRLGVAPLHAVLLEYQQQSLLLSRVNPRTTLALLIRDAGALSVVKYLVRKQLPVIAAALAEPVTA